MRIVHISETTCAYMPARFVHLINKYTPHEAKLIQIKDFFLGNPLKVKMIKTEAEIMAALKWATHLHFHGSGSNRIYRQRKIRLANKKTIPIGAFFRKPYLVHYHGSPQREHPAANQLPGFDGGKLLLSTPEMLLLFKNGVFFPNLIDETLPLYASQDVAGYKKMRVCHHFSLHSAKKNTSLFMQARDAFKRNGNKIDLVYLAQMTLREALAARSHCHAVFDHIQGYYGLVSIEGMAQGLCVLNGANKHTMNALDGFFGAKPPFMIVDRNNFVDVINSLTMEKTAEIGSDGVDFVRKYWSGKANIGRLIDIYKKL